MKYLILCLIGLVSSCGTTEFKTYYTHQMAKIQAEKQYKPKTKDKGTMVYYEGTIVGTGVSKVDGEISILEPIRDGLVDGVTSATKLFRNHEPNKAKGKISLSKDAIEVMFMGAMTNNLENSKLDLPELTLKLFVKDDGTIEYGEWEYLRIGCQNLAYYGTYRVMITNNIWDPNASTVSRPGTSDAKGTASWDSATKTITMTTVFTGNDDQQHTVESIFQYKEIYRQYDAILKDDYDYFTDYHIYNKRSS